MVDILNPPSQLWHNVVGHTDGQSMDKTIRFGLTSIPVSKPPFLEWSGGIWRCWMAYDSTLSNGTYVELLEDGRMVRVTKRDGTVVDYVLIPTT